MRYPDDHDEREEHRRQFDAAASIAGCIGISIAVAVIVWGWVKATLMMATLP